MENNNKTILDEAKQEFDAIKEFALESAKKELEDKINKKIEEILNMNEEENSSNDIQVNVGDIGVTIKGGNNPEEVVITKSGEEMETYVVSDEEEIEDSEEVMEMDENLLQELGIEEQEQTDMNTNPEMASGAQPGMPSTPEMGETEMTGQEDVMSLILQKLDSLEQKIEQISSENTDSVDGDEEIEIIDDEQMAQPDMTAEMPTAGQETMPVSSAPVGATSQQPVSTAAPTAPATPPTPMMENDFIDLDNLLENMDNLEDYNEDDNLFEIEDEDESEDEEMVDIEMEDESESDEDESEDEEMFDIEMEDEDESNDCECEKEDESDEDESEDEEIVDIEMEDESESDEDESEEEEEEELEEVGGISFSAERRAGRREKAESGDRHHAPQAPLSQISEIKARYESKMDELIKENDSLKQKISEYNNSFIELRKQFNEMQTFNAKLAYANKIFSNGGLTNDEKVKIAEEFDRVETIEEAKKLYQRVIKENNINVKKNVITQKINESLSKEKSTKSQTLFENKEAQRMKLLAGLNKEDK